MIIKFGIVFLPGSRFSSRALSNCGERARLAQSKKSLKSGLVMGIYKQTKEEILTPTLPKNKADGFRNALDDRSLKNPLHPKWRKSDKNRDGVPATTVESRTRT